MLAQIVDGGSMKLAEIAEAMGVAWALMMLSALCGAAVVIPAHVWPLAESAAAIFQRRGADRQAARARSRVHALAARHRQAGAGAARTPTSAENIEALITAGTEEGLIEEEDRKLIQSVVAFGDKVVREIMTPRPNMVTIQADQTLEALHELVVNEQYSRIPVYGTIDR